MRNLWLCFNGTPADEQHFNLPSLDYPLCFKIPRTSWSDSYNKLQLNSASDKVLVHVDILAEVNKTIRNRKSAQLDISGYRLCIGFSDLSLIDNVSNPTIRDVVVAQYYSRFHEHANLVSGLIKLDNGELTDKFLTIHLNGKKHVVTLKFNFTDLSIMKFLSEFVTLSKGDLISMGTILYIDKFPEEKTLCSVEFERFLLDVQITQ